MSLYVQYGCHWWAPHGWINYDASPTLRLERLPLVGRFVHKNNRRFPDNVFYGDIVAGLPLPTDCSDGVYCSHVIEHLSRADCRRALLNTHKILKRNGVFRFVIPDLEFYTRKYITSNLSDRAFEFNISTGFGQIKRPRGIRELIIETFGNSRHRWMWDFGSMQQELLECGFTDVRRAKFGDSSDNMFKKVEQRERWVNALGIECKKSHMSQI